MLETLQNIKTLDSKPTDVCKCCGRTGSILDELGLCSAEIGNCSIRFNYKKLLPRAYVDKKSHSFTINTKNRLAFDKTMAFANLDRSLYIWGPTGHGKTHLLSMGFIEAMNKYIPSKYLNVPKLLLIDRFEYETREESELRTVQELMRYKLLFLDDMGAETVTGRTRELLYLILNNAIENGSQRLFITSNKPLSYFVEHVDDRIASRIAGLCGKDNVLKLVDQDRRLA